MPPDPPKAASARQLVLAWAASPGFAAIHTDIAQGSSATDEQIVEDLLRWIDLHDFEIVRKKWRK